MSTLTVCHPISAITTGGVGVTLPPGDYDLRGLLGSDPDLARVYDAAEDRFVYVGRNTPGVTVNGEKVTA